MEKQPKTRKLIDLAHPGPSGSPIMQGLAEDNWSMFGKHERLDVKKKLVEHPGKNPIDPATLKTGAGGQ